MNPNIGRRYCTIVHESRGSLALTKQPKFHLGSPHPPPNSSPVVDRVDSFTSPVEPSQQGSRAWQQVALARACSRPAVAAGTTAMVCVRLAHDLFPTCSSRMQELFNSREIAADCA